MDLGLRNRACIVTGGSRGIGLVVAKRPGQRNVAYSRGTP